MSLNTLDKIYQSGTKLTPMMAQYYEIKKQHENDIVFFRMGDFYEVFFEDAKQVSKILNIALTHRGKLGDTPVPMAGIPHHAANNYIDKITEAGIRVAVCEQVENPKDAVGIVRRAVTQVVSPGLPYDLSKVTDTATFYIASISKKGPQFFSVFLDYSTGDFFGHITSSDQETIDLCQKYSVKEIVSYPGQFPLDSTFSDYIEKASILKSILAQDYFNEKNSKNILEKFIPNYKQDHILRDFPSILSPLSALCSFIDLTQKPEKIQHLSPFRLNDEKNKLYVSMKTLNGLEIIAGKGKISNYSLYDFMKKTKTPMGSRELKNYFSNALTNKDEIQLRLNLIEYFMENISILQTVEESLDQVRDIDRILTKISTNKFIPQDLINLATSLFQYIEIKKQLNDLPESLKNLAFNHTPNETFEAEIQLIIKNIQDSINPELSASIEKRNLILAGFDTNRDHLFDLYANSAGKFDDLERKYLNETGIPKIKIKHNNIHGRFIEVSKLHSEKVPDYFNRRQTLVQCERYVTEELSQLETECLEAGEKLKKIEQEIVNAITSKIISNIAEIKLASNFIAFIDIFHSFALTATIENWCRPQITDSELKIIGGWHPLIKKSVKDAFVPHDITLDNNAYFGLITGPNMAGKTTVMRELALIQLLGQIGSFVPAISATLPICDKIFSRLGASDNIQDGQSTFMVEMSETAEIIRHATKESLISLDEIGRGTSTYDGLSIAWSLVEYLVKKLKAKTLFATHYHELIELVSSLPGAKNLTVEAKSEGENVQFLYRLIEESANQSYGIYVAKLAGLPKIILNRAKTKLNELEMETKLKNDQLTFWDFQPKDHTSMNIENSNETTNEEHFLQTELDEIDLNYLTPMQAFEKLKSWKQLSKQLNH